MLYRLSCFEKSKQQDAKLRKGFHSDIVNNFRILLKLKGISNHSGNIVTPLRIGIGIVNEIAKGVPIKKLDT
jgi:hypothetical protein